MSTEFAKSVYKISGSDSGGIDLFRDKYKVEDTIATHVVSVIWNQLHIKYPMNLPNFLLNPYAIYRN